MHKVKLTLKKVTKIQSLRFFTDYSNQLCNGQAHLDLTWSTDQGVWSWRNGMGWELDSDAHEHKHYFPLEPNILKFLGSIST